MGVGQPSTLRIVGDRTKMAMPETRIGLFPDVGGTYYLSRCPGALGLYIGLTSHIITGSDAIACGLADLYMTRDAQQAFVDALHAAPFGDAPLADITRLARAHASAPPVSPLQARAALVEKHFADKANVTAIIASLRGEGSSETDSERVWCAQVANDIEARSPTLLEVTKHQIETGATMTLADCFRRELNMVHQCFTQRDVVEGIRALAIDKDNQPKWQPATLAEVTPESVEAFFTPRWTTDAHPLRDLEKQYG
jgi:enoyl-CoA hydratase